MSIGLIVVIVAIIAIFFESTRWIAIACFGITLFSGSLVFPILIIIGWLGGYKVKLRYFDPKSNR
ncbi:hypothetical protein JCM30760_11090 [Thiomicrorhabdus hydrogeniphila]